jgi:hypothetical protein
MLALHQLVDLEFTARGAVYEGRPSTLEMGGLERVRECEGMCTVSLGDAPDVVQRLKHSADRIRFGRDSIPTQALANS